MKIGYWGARGDMRGLAYQSQGFVKHIPFDRVMCIDMTADDLSPYPCDFTPFANWNHNLTFTRNSEITEETARAWLRGLDVVLGAETFYRDEFVLWARSEGVRTVLQINPEFTSYYQRGNNDPVPDVLVNPSVWRQRHLPNVIHLPFPVDRELFPYVPRTKGEHFVHVAGHGAAADRAGTRAILGSYRRLMGTRFTIRTQSPIGFFTQFPIEGPFDDPRDLFRDADVLVQPRRYGGQSLVANEALSCGIPIIVLNREPDSQWGGVYPVTCRVRGHLRTKAGLIPVHDPNHGTVADAVKRLAASPDSVAELSARANDYAESISWNRLLPKYMDLLCS